MSPNDPRRLAGIRFGLSISAADDMPIGRGDPEQAVNSLTFRFATGILLDGGSLALGHRWSSDGIMEHLAFQARDTRRPGLYQAASAEAKQTTPILNLIAWPDVAPDKDHNAQRMIRDGILEVRQIPPPDIPLDQLEPDPAKALATDLGKFARIRALTAMRKKMVQLTDSRVCLGGRIGGRSLRRLPGVIEEALFTHQAGKPLFISGSLGGAAKAMADAILHRRMSDESRAMFFTSAPAVELFAKSVPSHPVPPEEGPSTKDGWNAFAVFEAIPLGALGRQSGLTEEEYIHLLTATDVQRVLGLALTGILRLRATSDSTT